MFQQKLTESEVLKSTLVSIDEDILIPKILKNKVGSLCPSNFKKKAFSLEDFLSSSIPSGFQVGLFPDKLEAGFIVALINYKTSTEESTKNIKSSDKVQTRTKYDKDDEFAQTLSDHLSGKDQVEDCKLITSQNRKLPMKV